MKLYYECGVSPTRFGHSFGHLQGGVLHRMDVSRYYSSVWRQTQK